MGETARSRRAYVTTPSTIGTQCFIFPICHDSGLHGRVMEVQAARRNIAPVLMDSVFADMINAEGGRLRKGSAVAANETLDDEDDNAEEELLPTWPGLESL